MKEHDGALAKYHKQLQEFQRLSSSSSISQDLEPPSPPKPPPPMVQFKLANRRQYPETVQSPHPLFRVSFMTSKKIVSKLATDRNMVRKKLTAAVEMVFRQDPFATTGFTPTTSTTSVIEATEAAMSMMTPSPILARPGYEYLIFPKRAVMWTTQDRLMELMAKELQNPRLYGERSDNTTSWSKSKTSTLSAQKSSPQNKTEASSSPGANSDQSDDSLTTAREERNQRLVSDPEIKFRWRNNRPPTLEPFWKHALPSPLSRTQQSNAYLNRFCPEAQEALAPIRQKVGRQRKAAIMYRGKVQRAKSRRYWLRTKSSQTTT